MSNGKREVKSEDEVIGFFDEKEYDGIKKTPKKKGTVCGSQVRNFNIKLTMHCFFDFLSHLHLE